MNSVKEVLIGTCYGIKDSFLGVTLLRTIDDSDSGERPPGRRDNRPPSATSAASGKKK